MKSYWERRREKNNEEKITKEQVEEAKKDFAEKLNKEAKEINE